MKLGLFAPFHPHGGSAQFLKRFLSQSQQDNLHIFCPKKAKSFFEELAPKAKIISGNRFQIELAISRIKLDVIFCPANQASFLARAPQVVMFQNSAPFTKRAYKETRNLSWSLRLLILRALIQISARLSKKIICISNYFSDLIDKKEKTTIIYRGLLPVDLTWNPHGNEVLYISHLFPYKNHISLLEAFALAKDKLPNDVRLTFVGADFYGAKEKLLLYAKSLGIQQLSILGSLSHYETLKRMSKAKMFVFPSGAENCPTTLIEAMQIGVPIIASNVPPMPEIAGNYPLYIDPYDPAGFADIIVDSFKINWKERDGARLDALRKFPSLEEEISMVYKVLKEAV